MRNTKTTSLYLAAVVAVSATAACGAPTDKAAGSTDTGSSGTLRIACSQTEDMCKGLAAAFTKETGIKTTYLTLGAGALIARLQATAKSGLEFDIWAGGQSENHLVAAKAGFVEDYKSPEAADLPEKYNNASGTWSGFYTDSLAFCANKDELKRRGVATPTSWDALLDPKLKGQIVVPNPASVGTGYMAIWTQYVLKKENVDDTFGYLGKLKANVLQFPTSAAAAPLMAGRGEVAVAVALDSDCATAIKQGMSNLSLSYPAEGTGYEVGAVSLLKGAKNPDAAKRYFDWLLTPKAQNQYRQFNSFASPTNPKAQVGEGTPKQDSVNQVPWDPAQAAERKAELVQKFQADILGGK